MDKLLKKTLTRTAEFYDQIKIGNAGPLGIKRSTDLQTLLACLDRLLNEKIINPHETLFLDIGCSDGRVNIFLSYLVKISVGIELDDWSLEEYVPQKAKLEEILRREGLLSIPDNISLVHGDSTDARVHQAINQKTGVAFEAFNLFYTYLVMHEEFAELIAEKAAKGSIFMVYGLHKILPRYKGLHLLEHLSPMEGILALYRKE